MLPAMLQQRSMLIGFLIILCSLLAFPGFAKKAPPVELAGVSCEIPPPLHCPDANCPGPMVIEQGTALEPKNRPKILPRLSLQPQARREGHLHPRPARPRLLPK